MIAATSGEEGRKALMREIGLGKVLADSPVPNVAQFIGAVTTQSKKPFVCGFKIFFFSFYHFIHIFFLPRYQVSPEWIIPRFLRTSNERLLIFYK